uniref:Uncharacterized protein n=1 Tax=Siphoviridae sp. ctkzC12 TaxID=2826446 RepID=A0A8S5LVY0_9CAUD|nr:MAG TPA: hypothetical protein [Siphoviridae sp. ctkzC12]
MANIYNEKAWIRYSQMPHKEAAKVSEIQANLEFLDQKLELAQRKLSMFDFYKITTYVSNGNDYQTAVDKLEPNTSLVCTESFVANNKNFSRGDIVYKYENGSVEHIRAERAGIYAPIELIKDSNSNYNIKYQYYSYEPTENSSIAENGKAKFAKEIIFPIQGTSSKGIYSEQQEVDSSRIITFKKVFSTDGKTIIKPFIRFYDEKGEEVY